MNQQNKTERWEEIIKLQVNDAWSRGANWACKGRGYAMDTDADRETETLTELVNNLLSDARREERERCLEETSKKMDNFIDFNGETYMVVKVNRQALTTAEESIRNLK